MRSVCGSQGTAEWLDSRRGRITASRIKDVMNTLKKGGEGAGRKRYKRELAMERLTGISATHYVTPAMEHGTAYEPIARSTYELDRDVMVEAVGFVLHPTMDFAGASPDGLVDPRGGIEIKSPQDDTIVEWIRAGQVVPEDHQEQCLWVMECCELDWLDFVAAHPRFRPLIVRMPRDEERIKEIREGVIQFEEEVRAFVEELRPWVVTAPSLVDMDREMNLPAPPVEIWHQFFGDEIAI